MTAYWINLSGLIFNIAGVVLVFFFGLPQPSHSEGVALGLELGNILDDGRTVAEHDEEIRRRKRTYSFLAHAALVLMIIGFSLQFVAAACPQIGAQ